MTKRRKPNAPVVFLFSFVHLRYLLAILTHFISHIGWVDDLRPSAKTENPRIEHITQFHFCLCSEVTFIYLFSKLWHFFKASAAGVGRLPFSKSASRARFRLWNFVKVVYVAVFMPGNKIPHLHKCFELIPASG